MVTVSGSGGASVGGTPTPMGLPGHTMNQAHGPGRAGPGAGERPPANEAYLPQLVQAVQQISLPVRVLAAVMVLFHFMSLLAPVFYRNMAVTPGEVPPPSAKIWTLVTGAYVEAHPIGLVVSVAGLLAAGTTLEPLWGTVKVMEYIAIVNLASITATVAIYIMLYAASETNLDLLFLPFSGFSAASLGFLVAFKQAYPQRVLSAMGIAKIASKDLPLVALGALLGLYLAGVAGLAPFLLAVNGFLASWTYLRHYQLRDGLRGDPSEAFAFEEFFPQPLQLPVKAVGLHVYRALALLQLCPTKARSFDLSQPSSLSFSMPATRNSEASRRQERALRDLDQRLQVVVVQQAQQLRQAPDATAGDSSAS